MYSICTSRWSGPSAIESRSGRSALATRDDLLHHQRRRELVAADLRRIDDDDAVLRREPEPSVAPLRSRRLHAAVALAVAHAVALRVRRRVDPRRLCPSANAFSSARATQKIPRLVFIHSRPASSSRIWWMTSSKSPSFAPMRTIAGFAAVRPSPHARGSSRARPRPSVPTQSHPSASCVERSNQVARQPVGARDARERPIAVAREAAAVGPHPERAVARARERAHRGVGRSGRREESSSSSARRSETAGPPRLPRDGRRRLRRARTPRGRAARADPRRGTSWRAACTRYSPPSLEAAAIHSRPAASS